jgi:hypothetical protein
MSETQVATKVAEWELDSDGNRIYEGKILIGVDFSMVDLVAYLVSKRPDLVSPDAELKAVFFYPEASDGGLVVFNMETDAKIAGPTIFKDVPIHQ